MSPHQLQVRKSWSNTTPRTLKTPQRSLRAAAVRPDQPASFPDLSIHPRCYSEATIARVASNSDCAQRELHNAGHGAAIARTPHPALGRHGPAERLVRSEGLEPPRFYSLPPQGSASTNSATSAREIGAGIAAGPDQRRRCNKSGMGGQGPRAQCFGDRTRPDRGRGF